MFSIQPLSFYQVLYSTIVILHWNNIFSIFFLLKNNAKWWIFLFLIAKLELSISKKKNLPPFFLFFFFFNTVYSKVVKIFRLLGRIVIWLLYLWLSFFFSLFTAEEFFIYGRGIWPENSKFYKGVTLKL